MTAGRVDVNGVKISYRVEGEGPPLVLIMGYRLNSAAWPTAFIASLKRNFTLITFDNRGTGQSDKPLSGYALANMACDVAAVLDGIAIERAFVLGYSMGGAIAQEFVRQFPDRVEGLVLCATMCGGRLATYADSPVIRVMRDLDGLSTQQIARRIWQVTYAPAYLEKYRDLAEDQMQREIAVPTPLHAADLQFQAFAQFDSSRALPHFRCPTLVLTGDLDRLVPPQNSTILARLIPGAELVVIPGGGHRVLWEAVQDCTDLITHFLTSVRAGPAVSLPAEIDKNQDAAQPSRPFSSMTGWFSTLPFMAAQAGFLTLSRSLKMISPDSSRFGDGKPIIILDLHVIGSEFISFPMSEWLKALGYRPTVIGMTVNAEDPSGDLSASEAVRAAAYRIGRKAVVLTHSLGLTRALRIVHLNQPWISDLIVFDALKAPTVAGIETHVMPSGWATAQALPRLLRRIPIQLIAQTEFDSSSASESFQTRA